MIYSIPEAFKIIKQNNSETLKEFNKNQLKTKKVEGSTSSGNWTRTSDLRVMSLKKKPISLAILLYFNKIVYAIVYSDL